MATRIGGPMLGTFEPPLTWGSMRSPLILNGFTHGASYSLYSRAWPGTVSPPNFFKWESGSLFRQVPWRGGSAPGIGTPYYWIGTGTNPDESYYTVWGVGIVQNPWRAVDNQDFQPLIGEAIDTDVGTFIITEDAHSTTSGGQNLTEQTGIPEIYSIGRLVGF